MLRRRAGTGPPDFVGVGTYLAGTEWWMRMLARHPRIAGPRGRQGPGTYFFEPFCTRELTDADLAAYHRHFARRPGQIAGEFSNRYSYDVWSVPLLARAAPDAKLLMILRDPIDIYERSLGYRQGKKLRWWKRRGRDDPIYMTEEVHRGRFGAQLRALTQFYAPERILILQFEQLLRDPIDEYRRTCRFLGVEDDFVPRALRREPRRDTSLPVEHTRVMRPFGAPPWVNLRWLRRAIGLGVPRNAILWDDIRASLLAELEPEVEAMLAYGPVFDLSLWRNFAHLGDRA
jgi:hypothetical protein